MTIGCMLQVQYAKRCFFLPVWHHESMTTELVYEDITEDAFSPLTKADLRNFERRLKSELPRMVTQLSDATGQHKSRHGVQSPTVSATR
jgi:hypothetical protein